VIGNAALDFYPIIYCSQGFFHDVGWTRNEVTTKDVYCNFMMGRKTDKKACRTFEKGILNKEFTQVEMILYSKGGEYYMEYYLPISNKRHILFFYKNNFIRTSRLKLGNNIRTTKNNFRLFQKCSKILRTTPRLKILV